MTLTSSKNEAPLKVSFQDLIKKDQEIVEHAYKAYYDKVEGKMWRQDENEKDKITFLKNEQGEPKMMHSTLAEVIADGATHTADGWATFVSAIKLYKQAPLTEENIQEVFNLGYRSGAEGKSYTGFPIPSFDELLDIQKAAWMSAAKAVQNYSPTPAPEPEAQQEEAASRRFAMSC